MNGTEFILLVIEEWEKLVLLSILSIVILYILIRKFIVGGIVDPLTITLVFGYSINYAVIVFLMIMDKIHKTLGFNMLACGLTLIISFAVYSMRRKESIYLKLTKKMFEKINGSLLIKIAIINYLIFSLIIINSIGFGIVADTNRYDVAQGYGAYIRILDFLTPFIISITTINILKNKENRKIKIIMLTLYILMSGLINGAKIAIIINIITVFYTLNIIRGGVNVKPYMIISGFIIGGLFALFALNINLEKNNETEGVINKEIEGQMVVLERMGLRILASGNTSWLLLPNEIVDKIERDSVLVRFIAPYLGITLTSKILNYPVGDYSIGRQALLYYDPNNTVAGGPTSHFDIFGYAYFGKVGSILFSALLGAILGSINRALRQIKKIQNGINTNIKIAFLCSIWTRAVLIIIEPTIGIAYIVDMIMYFFVISGIVLIVKLNYKNK